MISNAYERICVDMSVYSCKYIPCMCSMGEGRSKASICKLPKLVSSSGFLWRTAMLLVVWERVCVVQKSACVTSAHQKWGGLLLLNGCSGHRSTKKLLEELETIKLKDTQKSENRIKVPRARMEEGPNWNSENSEIYPSVWFMHTICVVLSMCSVVERFSSHLPWLWLAVGLGA